MATGHLAQATWLEQETFESYPAGAPLRRALDIFNHANANNDGLDPSESYAAGAAPELPWSLSDSGIMGEVASHGTVIYVNHAATGAHNGTPGLFEVTVPTASDRGFLRLSVRWPE